MILTNTKKNFLIVASVCLVAVLFFVFGMPARSAHAYIIDIDNSADCGTHCTNLPADGISQDIKPAVNFISGFTHYGTGWPADVWLCSPATHLKYCEGSDILYHATTTPYYYLTRSSYDFGENIAITAGETYTFQMFYPSMVLQKTNTNNNYPDGELCHFHIGGADDCSSGLYDLNFTTFYEEIPADYIDLQKPENGATYTDFEIPLQVAFTISTTTIEEYDQIGVAIAEISTSTPVELIFQEIYGDTDLMNEFDTYIFTGTTTILLYGAHATAGALYGIHAGDPEWHFITISDTNYWLLLEDWGVGDEEICNDIATSTIMGSIECAFRKLGYWAFYPSKSSIDELNNSYTDLKGSFPFNTFFQLTDAVQGAISTTTTNMDGTIDVVFIDSEGNFTILPVLASSSMPNLIGQENTTLIRNTITWIMWLGVAFLVFLTFKKI